MRFLKNFLSLISAVMFSLGVAMTIAPIFNDDLPALGVLGVPMVIQAVVISVLMSLSETKGNRVVAIVFFWVNGFIIFGYFTVVLIPFMKIIKNLLPDTFIMWKENVLSKKATPEQKQHRIQEYLSLADIEE